MSKIEVIEVYGDKYKVRRTYDISDDGEGIYGYDIYDENGKFLDNFVTGNVDKLSIDELEEYIKKIII